MIFCNRDRTAFSTIKPTSIPTNTKARGMTAAFAHSTAFVIALQIPVFYKDW
jgi:hypothetical protein